MPRPDLEQVPEFYHGYIQKAPGKDVKRVILEQTPVMLRFFSRIPVAKRNYRYARDKWTLKELVQHLIDSERVFAYRALCFARQDKTPLPSFDENLYGDTARAAKRDWKDLVEELKAVRRATEFLFGSFDREQLNTTGIASNRSFSVLAIGFIIAGHINHHIDIIRERYL